METFIFKLNPHGLVLEEEGIQDCLKRASKGKAELDAIRQRGLE